MLCPALTVQTSHICTIPSGSPLEVPSPCRAVPQLPPPHPEKLHEAPSSPHGSSAEAGTWVVRSPCRATSALGTGNSFGCHLKCIRDSKPIIVASEEHQSPIDFQWAVGSAESFPETALHAGLLLLPAPGLFSTADGQSSLSQAFRFRRVAAMRITLNMKAD